MFKKITEVLLCELCLINDVMNEVTVVTLYHMFQKTCGKRKIKSFINTIVFVSGLVQITQGYVRVMLCIQWFHTVNCSTKHATTFISLLILYFFNSFTIGYIFLILYHWIMRTLLSVFFLVEILPLKCI